MDINYKAIGKRIKLARIRKDMKQDGLAERAGLSTSHMSNIETGKTKVSLPSLIALANALSVSVDELLCDNMDISKAVFEKEAQEILSDSTDNETKIMVGIMSATKSVLRENKELFTQD